MTSIVAGIAEVDQRDPHLAAAVELAETLGAELHLVHAFSYPDPILFPAEPDPEWLDRLERELRSRLERWIEQVPRRDRLVCHAVPGSASEAILEVAQRMEADLVVVGASRLGTLGSIILGTTAQRVLRASPVPVFVDNRAAHVRPGRVLFTTDLSQPSAAVHERGLALVSALFGSSDLEIHSLFVAGDDVLLPPPLRRAGMREKAEEQLGVFLSRIEFRGLSVQGKVRLGLSAREILAEAEEWGADLLVLGTHSRTGASRFLIGSVAETVLRNAPCDVLLLPRAALAVVGGGSP